MPSDNLSAILAHFEGTKHESTNGGKSIWAARCPAHTDRTASLSISDGNVPGKVVIHCHAGCDTATILARVGLELKDLQPPRDTRGRVHTNGYVIRSGSRGTYKPTGRIVAVYPYRKPLRNGTIGTVYEVVRFDPKDFRMRRPEPSEPSGVSWSCTGLPRVIYRLPEVIAAREACETLYVVEGEKDANNAVAKLGICTTTNAGGAKKWEQSFNPYFRDANVVIIPDNDEPGRKHARTVGRALLDVAASVKVVALPGLSDHGDLSDWIEASPETNTREALEALVADTEPLTVEEVLEADQADAKAVADEICEHSALLTEQAIMLRFLDTHKDNIRHSTALGWCHWDGIRWVASEKEVADLVSHVGNDVRAFAKTQLGALPDKTLAKQYEQVAARCESRVGQYNIRALLALSPVIDAPTNIWDTHPHLLNCPNGIVNLSKGTLVPHDKSRHLTKLCPTPFIADAKCPTFLKFLSDIFSGDQSMVDYFQWVCGYSLTGMVSHSIFFVLHGNGANGKSTLLRCIQEVLGEDYSTTLNPETILQTNNSQHQTDIARLRGARFAVAQETGEGRRINEPLVKSITGGDKMSARFMHKDAFQFSPELKLFIGTNHRPSIRDDSKGMWRRIRLLPFEAEFQGKDCDPRILEKLLAERAGILAWAVQAAPRADVEHTVPARARIAVDEYRLEENQIELFISESCNVARGLCVSKKDLFSAYYSWASGHCESINRFGRRLKTKGYESKTIRLTNGSAPDSWVGIAIKDGTQFTPDSGYCSITKYATGSTRNQGINNTQNLPYRDDDRDPDQDQEYQIPNCATGNSDDEIDLSGLDNA